MSRRRSFKPKSASASSQQLPPPDGDNPTLAAFRAYARELDAKHDRYERIVKRSRDITIESKRIIFQLHTVKPHAPDAQTLSDARNRLDQLVRTSFAGIADELYGLDHYQFVRAYSAGLQEFIEALTYWQYVAGERLTDWRHVESMLTVEKSVPSVGDDPPVTPVTDESQAIATDAAMPAPPVEADDGGTSKEPNVVAATNNADATAVEAAAPIDVEAVTERPYCTVDAFEYLQGLGDLSGEVMRQCIGALGAGNFDTCFRGCAFLRSLYMGYNGLVVQRNRSLMAKMSTLRQSLLKVEHVCYNIKVRGKEAGTLSMMNADPAAAAGSPDDDEGFSNF